MAERNSSVVAIVAIVVIIAIAALLYFVIPHKTGTDNTTVSTPKVEAPATNQ